MKSHVALRLVALFLAVAATVVAASERRARFITLAGHAGAEDMTIASHMSDDGDFVVGEAPTDYLHGEGAVAEREHDGSWTVRRLGFFPDRQYNYSPAFNVSRNGRAIIGFGSDGDPEVTMPWASFGGGPLAPLGLFPGDALGAPYGITAQGHIIVGWGSTSASDRFEPGVPFRHALLWRHGGGTPVVIDAPPEGPVDSTAVAVADSGRVIAGFAQSPRSVNNPYLPTDERGHEAIVWTRLPHGNYQRQWLGALPGHSFHSRAFDISEDGERIVGVSGVTDDRHPVLWTRDHRNNHSPCFTIRDLGTLPGYPDGGAVAISANGRVVVGSCSSSANGDFVATAFIWDEQHGMRELATFLRARGAIIAPDLTLVSGSGLSRDGRRICGYAYDLDYNLIAWVAELP